MNADKKLNAARVVIEHAFGILKAKFRRLKCLHMKGIEHLSATVTACCILYNICLDPGDHVEEEEQAQEDSDDPHPPQPNSEDASNYRDRICSHI